MTTVSAADPLHRSARPALGARAAPASEALSALWREYWPAVGRPYVVQRTLLLFAVFFGAELIGVRRTWHALGSVPFLDMWIRWDSSYYVAIASEGYVVYDWGSTLPFFPLYPMFIVILGTVMPKPLAALVVSHLAAVVALGFLYAWIKSEVDEVTAKRAVEIALVFPTSYFLCAAYSESVFLLVATGTLLAWSRKKPWLAALGVVGACLSRPPGAIALTVPFVAEWLASRRKLREAPWFTLAAVPGLALLLLIYHASTGSRTGFASAPQVESLGKYAGTNSLSHFFGVLWEEGWSNNLMRRFLNWSALALVASSAVHFVRRKRFDLALLAVLPVAIPLAFQRTLLDAASMGRYALVGFPIFLSLARWVPSGARARTLDTAFQMAQLVLALNFATARWAE
jgi:hypothetical protein